MNKGKIAIVSGMMLLSGCAPKERVPFFVRDCLTEVQVDAYCTLCNIEDGRQDANAAVDCLRRILYAKKFADGRPAPGNGGFMRPVLEWIVNGKVPANYCLELEE